MACRRSPVRARLAPLHGRPSFGAVFRVPAGSGDRSAPAETVLLGGRGHSALVVLLVTFARKCRDAGAVRRGRRERAMAAPLPRLRTQHGGDRRPAFPVKRCEKGHYGCSRSFWALERGLPTRKVAARMPSPPTW